MIRKSHKKWTAILALVGTASLYPVASASSEAYPQSRPPMNSGATGGANPGNAGSGGFNPGGGNSGGSNSGGSGGSFNPGNSGQNQGGSGGNYNPGGSGQDQGGSGYNPGNNGNGYNGGYGMVTVYRDANYRGGSVRFTDAIANLRDSGLNDGISSMQLRGDWEGCSDANFRGRCVVFRNSVHNLSNIGMNDRISSLRPVRRGGGW